MDPTKEKEIEEEYLSSLMDLNVNSKPLINMLTMLADENLEYAHVIVKAVEKHLAKVSPDVKLPILYLIDSIVKNVDKSYKQLFAQNIVNMFCGVFEKVNEKVREKMYSLRQTWNDVFPQTKLYALDVKVNVMDNNWPITAKIVPKSVHVNPNFLKNKPPSARPQNNDPEDLLNQMKAKERELIELKQRKIELELMVTKKKIAESEREMRGSVNQQPPFHAPVTVAPALPNVAIPQQLYPSHQGRVRIAPVTSAMIAAARSRDPRIMRARALQTSHNITHASQSPVTNMSVAKSLPRIPKFSQAHGHVVNSNNKTSRTDERDPRNRRNKEKDEKSNKNSVNSSNKHKIKTFSRPNDHNKKSGSSDDSSPRKKGEDDKKSTKSSSSRNRSRSRSSPLKSSNHEPKDVDLRLTSDVLTKPERSTTSKDKHMSNLLNGEDLKSSHEMITSDNEGRAGTSTIRDTDLRFVEGAKKRSLSPEPSEEPSNKKNRAEADLLFGSKDVDLRNLGEPTQSSDRRSKSKERADFEAVRAKLNATKEKSKLRPGIKLLDEFPAMPPSESANTELVKKILARKDKNKDVKDIAEPIQVQQVEVVQEINPPPVKQSRFNSNQIDERMDDVADLGNLTAAELRKSSTVPASIRKDKRKGSKWNQPENPWPASITTARPPLPPAGHMMPQHFINPWESNPMILAMQKQSQMPLVVPQSISHPVLNTKLRTLRLDGTKDHLLRFYRETAIIFNEQGDPHDIKFSSGQSRVIIDDQYTADLNFNDAYQPIFIDSTLHQIKFGSPTRELYIDQHFYECYFNNQPTQIVLNDKLRMVRIQGNAPEVKIGRKRNDLVLGLINIVIDAEVMIPIFLDISVQYFEFKQKIFTLQFADFFNTVVINNEPFKVEYGGLPKNYTLNGQKHFIRFTGFPEEFTPGRVNMFGMRRTNLSRNCKSPPLIKPMESNEGVDIGQLVENDMRGQQQIATDSHMMMQTNSMTTNMIPGIGHEAQAAPTLGVPNLDINDLLKKLVATGIIGGAGNAETTSAPKNKEKKEKTPERSEEPRKNRGVEERKPIIPINLSRPDTIKKRQIAIVDTLYLGIQCSSCGLRFPPEQTMKYSQHLDWHFRQNRRERDSKRRAHFRKWYYNQSDWIKYEEIEDLEERDKNFFETQQMESMMGDDSNNAGGNAENAAEVSCPAGPLNIKHICEVCHDEFDQFFDEETEEWHLRSALKQDEKFFHPICYDDFKASFELEMSRLNEPASNEIQHDDDDVEMTDASDVVIKAEPKEEKLLKPSGLGDDDDDVMFLPAEEQVVTEILDESEMNEENVVLSSVADDDVMIQEPKIDTQIVPDDDDDDDRLKSSTSAKVMHDDFIVKIKEEPKDDGYEDLVNEEDAFVEVTAIASDDHMHDEAYARSPKAPFQPAQDENAVFDEASLMMPSPSSNDEQSRDSDNENNSRPESSGAPLIGGNKKLKIVLSSLAQTNLSNKNHNSNSNVNDQNENSNLDSVNKLDSNSVELQSDVRKDDASASEEPEIEYQVKPKLQGIKFERNVVPVKRGLENSGLCSIM